MAKEGKGTNQYLLAIVSIVAIVGLVILVLNIGSSGTVSVSSTDLSGQAVKVSKTLGAQVPPQEEWVKCGNGEIVFGVPCSEYIGSIN